MRKEAPSHEWGEEEEENGWRPFIREEKEKKLLRHNALFHSVCADSEARATIIRKWFLGVYNIKMLPFDSLQQNMKALT